MDKNGFPTRTKLARELTRQGFPITDEALGAYFSGKAMPRSEILIGLNKVFGVSIDWLLTGNEPKPPHLEELKQMIDAAVVDKGFVLRDLDPEIAKIIKALIDLDPSERAPLAAMVEAYVNQRGRK